MNQMYHDLVKRIRVGLRWVDDQAPRQRVFLLIAVVAVLFTLWDAVFMRSVKDDKKQAGSNFEMLEKQVLALELQAQATLKRLAEDPNLKRRKRKAELEEQLADLEARFSERTADLIQPSEMVRVIKELLNRETTLELVRLESLAAEPLLSPEESGSEDASSRISVFRHGLRIEMVGDYLSALRYLQAVEALPWKFFWESLKYDVEEHPRGRITLKVLSLSTEEGWIGV